mmetsp:Transcript_17397/g.39744  ORF Transcript_17397/g.39744 Transcript_17397/m.39744 type:complete len:280 (-) Transcript_17397:21-860(-)
MPAHEAERWSPRPFRSGGARGFQMAYRGGMTLGSLSSLLAPRTTYLLGSASSFSEVCDSSTSSSDVRASSGFTSSGSCAASSSPLSSASAGSSSGSSGSSGGGRCASSNSVKLQRKVRSIQWLNSLSTSARNVCVLYLPSAEGSNTSSNSSMYSLSMRPLTTGIHGVHRGASLCARRGLDSTLVTRLPAFLTPLMLLFSAKRTCTPSSSRRASAECGMYMAPSMALWRSQRTPVACSSTFRSTTRMFAIFCAGGYTGRVARGRSRVLARALARVDSLPF